MNPEQTPISLLKSVASTCRRALPVVIIAFTTTYACTLHAQRPQNSGGGGANLPGIDWSVDEIKASVAGVRAGRSLLPKAWPNGAKVAVVFSFDVDNDTPPLPSGTTEAGPLSDREYGATEGIPRFIKILNKYNIPATFFTPAVSDILAPDLIPLILKSGKNEIALHGYIHEPVQLINNGPTEERLLNQAIDYLTKVTGKTPVGSRTGAWTVSKYTLGIDQKLGLLYDSSLMAMDVPYEIMSNGKDTGLVELPVSWILDDAPYFSSNGSLPYPEEIYKVFRDEFDVAYRDGTFIMFTMHPQVSGRRSREIYLDQLIGYIKSKPGVWFATAEEVAKYVKANAPAEPIPAVR